MSIERFTFDTRHPSGAPPYARKQGNGADYITVDREVEYRGEPTAHVHVGPTRLKADNRRELHEYQDGNKDRRLVPEGDIVYWAWSLWLDKSYPKLNFDIGRAINAQVKSIASNGESSSGQVGISPQFELLTGGPAGTSNGAGQGGLIASVAGGNVGKGSGGMSRTPKAVVIPDDELERGAWHDLILGLHFDHRAGWCRIWHAHEGDRDLELRFERENVPTQFIDLGYPEGDFRRSPPNGARWGVYRGQNHEQNIRHTFDLRLSARWKCHTLDEAQTRFGAAQPPRPGPPGPTPEPTPAPEPGPAPEQTLTMTLNPGAPLVGRVMWEVLPEPPAGVEQVELLIDGRPWAIEVHPPYRPVAGLDTTSLDDGMHLFLATALYADGRRVSAELSAEVANGSTQEPAPEPPDINDKLRELLVGDLMAIRNNSRSTAGDPAERLRSNVGRAELALTRLGAEDAT